MLPLKRIFHLPCPYQPIMTVSYKKIRDIMVSPLNIETSVVIKLEYKTKNRTVKVALQDELKQKKQEAQHVCE